VRFADSRLATVFRWRTCSEARFAAVAVRTARGMHPRGSGGAYGRRSEVREWRRLCVASQNRGFPHGEGDQQRFGDGSMSGRGCCRSRECRCNGGSNNMLNEDDGGEGNTTEL